MKALELFELAKSYREFRLGPISVNLPAGRAYGILGPNGAGKTTLLSCIAAHLHHLGRAVWSGDVITDSQWRMREAIAYVYETPILYGDLTVSRTLHFCSTVYRRWDAAVATEWMARMNLDGRKYVKELSKGMRIKLALLVGISHRAELLLLDEPTAGLDPESRRDLQIHLKALCRDPAICLIISSHLFEDIEAIADEVIILRNGAVQLHMPAALLRSAILCSVERSALSSVAGRRAVILAESERRLDLMIFGSDPEHQSEAEAIPNSRPASISEIYFALSRDGEVRSL